jgi:hypothetical protein
MSGEAEQIWANKLRFYREDAPRSGVVVGDVLDLPSGPAAASREVDSWVGRIDVWRNPQPQTPAHERHTARLTVTVGRAFLAWFLDQHAPFSAGVANFDRLTPSPTFCLEVETEKGDRFIFRGVAVSEFQLTIEPMQIVNLDMSLEILERRTLDALTPATRSFDDPAIPAYVCEASFTFGAWGLDPRTTDRLVTYAASLFFTRRNLRACQFNADGIPTRFTASPWRVLAEVRLPRGPLVDAAKKRAVGRLGLFIGPDGADLEFLANVTAYTTTDPLKAWDHRDEVLSIEMHPDATGSLLFVRDNYTPGI